MKNVQAEVQKIEMENIRYSARILANKRKSPEIEKKIVVEGNANPSIDVDNSYTWIFGLCAMDKNKQIKKFAAAIEKAFSGKTEKIDDQIDFDDKYQHLFKKEYEEAIKIINTVKDADMLSELMRVYLSLYAKYSANANNIHFHRSDQTYYLLFGQSTRVSNDKRDIFEEWAGFLDASPDKGSYNSFKKRFDELSTTYQSLILSKIADRRGSKTILDLLRDAFYKKYQRKAKDHDELYDFDPVQTETLKWLLDKQLDTELDKVRQAWNVCAAANTAENLKAFHNSLDKYRKYLAGVAKGGLLNMFQIIKDLRDKMKYKFVSKGNWTQVVAGESSNLMCELYTMACLQLLVDAVVNKKVTKNSQGFTEEEQNYFLQHLRQPTRPYPYISNLEKRFTWRFENVNETFDYSKVFLDLILFTKNQPNRTVELVNLRETLRIQEIWVNISELTQKLKEVNEGGQKKLLSEAKNQQTLRNLLDIVEAVNVGWGAELAKGSVRAGISPGENEAAGRITIIYIDRKHWDFYIEYEKFKTHLFKVTENYISDALYGKRIMSIYYSTVGVVYMTNFLFVMMGFWQVVISGGFTALVYEVLIYYSSIKLEELASEVDPIFGKIVGFAAQIAVPRPSFKPKVVEPGRVEIGSVPNWEGIQPQRSFAEILAQQKAEGKLIADFNRGTIKGGFARFAKSLRDTVMAYDLDLVAVLKEIKETSLPLATNEGVTFRVTQSPKGIGASGGRGVGEASRAETALQKSEVYKALEEKYYPLLTRDEQLIVQKELNNILQSIRNGTLKYSEAAQEILNLLNAAKETIGEYVADGMVFSSFKVLEVVSIPRRENQVPMLDRVYKVKDYDTGSIYYLICEIKGGVKTKLGYVTKKTYTYKNNKLTISVVKDQLVKQASPEWYFQRIIEIYESGYQDLARKIFEAAKSGKVQSSIIKSGSALEPFAKFNTDDIIKWFKDKKLPYD